MSDRSIAHYNLLERIGESALGEVYRARDTKFGRTVALKVVKADALEGAPRDAFLDDARTAATLSHPNIATLFDVGEYDGGCYLAYEFATGVTLRQEIAGRYVLGYTSTDERTDGAWRKVRIRVTRPDLEDARVRTREGYFAPYKPPK